MTRKKTAYLNLGPKASLLSKQHLLFALSIAHSDKSGIEAMKEAAANAEITLEDAASLACDPAIVGAVEELARQRMAFDVPLALQVLRRKMTDKFSKDAVSSAKLVLERAIPSKTEMKVETDKPADTDTALVDYLARLKAIGVGHDQLVQTFGPAGLARLEVILSDRAKVIEHEALPAPEKAVELEKEDAPEKSSVPATDDLEDLL
jgi:hypothetical protein